MKRCREGALVDRGPKACRAGCNTVYGASYGVLRTRLLNLKGNVWHKIMKLEFAVRLGTVHSVGTCSALPSTR